MHTCPGTAQQLRYMGSLTLTPQQQYARPCSVETNKKQMGQMMLARAKWKKKRQVKRVRKTKSKEDSVMIVIGLKGESVGYCKECYMLLHNSFEVGDAELQDVTKDVPL